MGSSEGIGHLLLFYVFILMASLTVMNMLVGVLVEVVKVVSTVEKEQLQVNFVKHRLFHMIEQCAVDGNGDGRISKSEFETLLQKPAAAKALHDVGVDVVGLVDFMDFLFQDGRELSFADFMEMVLSLRGTNVATVKDIVDLRKCVMSELSRLEEPFRSFDLAAGGCSGGTQVWDLDGNVESDGTRLTNVEIAN